MIKDHKTGALPYVGETEVEGAHCCVKHPHAGGPCERPAAMTVYGLHFCREHGAQVAEGALEEAQHDAEAFLDSFRDPEMRPFPVLVSRAIEAASSHVFELEGVGFYEGLLAAFPKPTPEVREMVERAELDDEPGYESFSDVLIGSLHCMHRCMRVAYEASQVWLLEILEGERQSIAAQCAYAVRDYPHAIEAALEAPPQAAREGGLVPAPIFRERDLGNDRVEAYYWQGEGAPAMAVSPALPYAARRARELEAHGYAEWVPSLLWEPLGACVGREDEVFCLAYSDPAKVPPATVLAIRSVIEEMEPGWVSAVDGAHGYADDPRVLAAWCEIPLQAVMACLAVLRERPGDAA